MMKKKLSLIAGVDEVGRGPLAGPVVAAVVILNPDIPIDGIRDSKKLSPKKREQLAKLISEHAYEYAIGRCEVGEIDTLNILKATLLAMQRAILKLQSVPETILVDGTYCPQNPYPTRAIIGGDQSVSCISAASIIAKVYRDNEMIRLDKQYPGYGFAQHKGYGTKSHLAALKKLGASPVHRRSFAPVRNLIRIFDE